MYSRYNPFGSKVEKIRPQFINKERGDPDENISAKDRYMRVYSFSIEERERERERERESSLECGETTKSSGPTTPESEMMHVEAVAGRSTKGLGRRNLK